MDELAKNAIAHVSLFIRVVASGLVSYALLLLLDPADRLKLLAVLQTDRGVWLALAGAALSGACAYALYMGVLEHLFLRPVIAWIRRTSPRDLPPALRSMAAGELLRLMYRERKARYAASNERVKELQHRVDTFYAWLVFLYCTATLVGASAIVAYHFDLPDWAWAKAAGICAAIGCTAFCADVFITRIELWLVAKHPQWV
jgi:hypothetical protein